MEKINRRVVSKPMPEEAVPEEAVQYKVNQSLDLQRDETIRALLDGPPADRYLETAADFSELYPELTCRFALTEAGWDDYTKIRYICYMLKGLFFCHSICLLELRPNNPPTIGDDHIVVRPYEFKTKLDRLALMNIRYKRMTGMIPKIFGDSVDVRFSDIVVVNEKVGENKDA